MQLMSILRSSFVLEVFFLYFDEMIWIDNCRKEERKANKSNLKIQKNFTHKKISRSFVSALRELKKHTFLGMFVRY